MIKFKFNPLKIGIFIFSLWLVFLIGFIVMSNDHFGFSKNWYSKSGQLGDTFGILNSLFSGLGFVGLLITINQQQKEIDRQSKQNYKQEFNNTFFKLIDLHNSLVQNLTTEYQSVSGLNTTKRTSTVFSNFVSEFQDNLEFFSKEISYSINPSLRDLEKNIKNKLISESSTRYVPPEVLTAHNSRKHYLTLMSDFFNKFYDDQDFEYDDQMSTYFQNLKNILYYLDESKFDEDFEIDLDEKIFYSNVLISQMSTSEMYVIFYYTMSEKYGYPTLNYLCDKYGVLDRIQNNSIIFPIYRSVYELLKITKKEEMDWYLKGDTSTKNQTD